MDYTAMTVRELGTSAGNGDFFPARTRYYINDTEITAFENMQLAHMNNVEATLKTILKELRKMNAPKRKSPRR